MDITYEHYSYGVLYQPEDFYLLSCMVNFTLTLDVYTNSEASTPIIIICTHYSSAYGTSVYVISPRQDF